MNIFILNSGRCGSSTWIRACTHIHNYSAGHETRTHLPGLERLLYPENHIEADNRLSWMLGRLEQRYGDEAFYVHLHRDPDAVTESFARRHEFGILKAYHEGILFGSDPTLPPAELAADYLATVEANIRLFMRGKTHTLEVQLEQADQDFPTFWEVIGAQGDLEAGLREFQTRHNSSEQNGLVL